MKLFVPTLDDMSVWIYQPGYHYLSEVVVPGRYSCTGVVVTGTVRNPQHDLDEQPAYSSAKAYGYSSLYHVRGRVSPHQLIRLAETSDVVRNAISARGYSQNWVPDFLVALEYTLFNCKMFHLKRELRKEEAMLGYKAVRE